VAAKCPSCDEYTDFAEAISPEYGVPYCCSCGCLLYGYDSDYVRCKYCRSLYRSDLPSCPDCGRSPDEILSGNQPLPSSNTAVGTDTLLALAQEWLVSYENELQSSETRGESPAILAASAFGSPRSGHIPQKRRTLDDIGTSIRNCRRCSLHTSRTRAVPGEGPVDAQVMFIGEAPGRAEDTRGRPFVGRSGHLLDRSLDHIGLRRQDVYITNIIKCRPPYNKDPLAGEIDACHLHLQRELLTVRPKVVATLGRVSFSFFVKGATLSEVHGKPQLAQGFIVLPMYHPAAVLRNPDLGPVFAHDAERIVKILEEGLSHDEMEGCDIFSSGKPEGFDRDHRVQTAGTVPSPNRRHTSELHQYVLDSSVNLVEFAYEVIADSNRLLETAEEIAQHNIIALDTETSGVDPLADALLLLQIATPDKVYIYDCTKVDVKALRNILRDPNILKIVQNAVFDYAFIKQHVGVSLANIFDTMLAERLLTAGISREISLQRMSEKYFGIKLEKSIRLSFADGIEELSDAQIRYAAEDAVILFFLYEQQSRNLEDQQLTRAAKLEFDAVIPIAEMELAGLAIDVEKWRTLIDAHLEMRDQAERETIDLLRPGIPQLSFFNVSPVNLNSQPQLLHAFSNLGIQLEDTSEATLKRVDHAAAKKLLEFREHDKIVASFGEKFLELIHPVTGHIHPHFRQYGADTGRLSCQKPNVQQIPAEFRSCFVARPGYKIITCDYSQAELRILAHLSRDRGFCEAFRSGGDLHSITASRVFGIPQEHVPKERRQQAKAINFGLAYGRGPASLASQLGVSKKEAESLIVQYFKTYTGIKHWLDKAARDALQKGYSTTPIGRKRFYEIPHTSDPDYRRKIGLIERQGKNSPIQGANADMIKYALVLVHQSLKSYDARLINTVHDEIVIEVREAQAEEVLRVIERDMIRAGEILVTEVPVVAEAVIADHWSK